MYDEHDSAEESLSSIAWALTEVDYNYDGDDGQRESWQTGPFTLIAYQLERIANALTTIPATRTAVAGLPAQPPSTATIMAWLGTSRTENAS